MDFWQQLAAQHGPWAIFLLIVLGFLRYWVLPFIEKRVEAADAALKEQIASAREALKETASAARDARKEDQTQFLRALGERDKVQTSQTQAIRELMEEIRGKR